jgi:hypothetical protein
MRWCRRFVALSLNKLAALGGASSGLGSAENFAKVEYALLIFM